MTKLLFGDCVDRIKEIAQGTVDAVLCDLPFGVTRNSWDCLIDLEFLFEEYERVGKPNVAIVLCAVQPFTSKLITKRPDLFKYVWTWDKVNKFSGHLNAKKQPLRITEDIVVFYRSQPTYNPQMVPGKGYTAISSGAKTSNYGHQIDKVRTVNKGEYYPKNLLSIPGDERGSVGRIHPTQKPVELMRYLVRTYTNKGDVILDNAMGSGTTGVACVLEDRSFIGIEKDKRFFGIAKQRIEGAKATLPAPSRPSGSSSSR